MKSNSAPKSNDHDRDLLDGREYIRKWTGLDTSKFTESDVSNWINEARSMELLTTDPDYVAFDGDWE